MLRKYLLAKLFFKNFKECYSKKEKRRDLSKINRKVAKDKVSYFEQYLNFFFNKLTFKPV